MKTKPTKAYAAVDRETGLLFNHKREIILHPTKKDALRTGYGKEYWKIIAVKIVPLTSTKR